MTKKLTGTPLETRTVEALEGIDQNLRHLANAVKPVAAASNKDAMGVDVSSLTEAVMGMTAALAEIGNGLHAIAGAINAYTATVRPPDA